MRSTQCSANGKVTTSVVIVNWNRQDYIKATLEDLRNHYCTGLEVLVVDNGSTDGAPDMIAAEFPEVRLVRLASNVGQCAGLNIGLRDALGDIVISLDNDATLEPGSIGRIITKFRDEPDMAVLHGQIVDYDTRENVWWWGWYGFDEENYRQHEFSTPWKIAEGMCALRRETVLAVGGFPEEYFIMEAGRDLAIRLIDSGYDICYMPEVTFYHKSSPERERTDRYRLHSDRRMYFKLRNELWTVWKYFPLHMAVTKTVGKMIAWAIIMARQGSFGCYLRAMVDAYQGIPMIVRKRRPVQMKTIKTVEYSRLKALKDVRHLMSWYFAVSDNVTAPTGKSNLDS